MNKIRLEDEKYMRRCFDLARLSAGYNAPNPKVGAVVVHNNRIIGEGYHQQYGTAHAEVNAVNSVKEEDKHHFSMPESMGMGVPMLLYP